MKIIYFSWIRERIGKEEEIISPPNELKNIKDLIFWLSSLSDGHKKAFTDLTIIRVAKNMNTANLDDKFTSKDEIAFFPPMTGG